MANIPFIHNYCDRWCERCCFTGSCGVYETEHKEEAGNNDIQSNAFWDRISRNLAKAKALIIEGAKEHGIDITHIPEEELKKIDEENQMNERRTNENELVNICEEYVSKSREFFQNQTLWKAKGDEMIQQEKMGTLGMQELEDQLRLMSECREIIQWYQFFIQVKFMRAISGLIDGDESLDEENKYQTDYNGSAKIALIAVERSKLAWTELFTVFPEEDLILPILSLLARIEKTANEKFPDAKKFIRPGFDELEKVEIPADRAKAKPGVFAEFRYGRRR